MFDTYQAAQLEAAQSSRDHESGNDAAGRTERRWLAWCAAAETILGIASLDGDQSRDGYSLDFAYAAFAKGSAPEAYAKSVRRAA